jgi:hypothetical protein
LNFEKVVWEYEAEQACAQGKLWHMKDGFFAKCAGFMSQRVSVSHIETQIKFAVCFKVSQVEENLWTPCEISDLFKQLD